MAEDLGHRPFNLIGLIMIILGSFLILIPYLAKYFKNIDKVHPMLVYVYRHNNFIFITSPILIVMSVLSILLFLFGRYLK